MKNYKNYLFGKPAFYKLNNPDGNYYDTLEKHHSPAQLKNGFVVRHTDLPSNPSYGEQGRKNIQRFILFSDHIDFLNFLYQVPLNKRNFFEIMLDKAQKPHFDIDIDLDDYHNFTDKSLSFDKEFEHTLSYVVNACKEVFAQYKLNLDVSKHVVICTSHGEKKRSAHVTIHGFSHTNCVEAKAFYILVRNAIPVRFQRWLDNSVYKPTQNWRLVGNQKAGTMRTKVFQKTWKLYDEGKWKTIEFSPETEYTVNPTVFQFEITLLQNFVSQMLPSFVDKAGEISTEIVRLNLYRENGKVWDDEPGDDETLNKVKELIKQKLGVDKFPFRVLHNYKGMIVFRRNLPYTCPVCQVKHQNQNPYCKIDKGVAWLDCRRSSAHTPDGKPKSTYLGRVHDTEQWGQKQEEEDDEEDELGRVKTPKDGNKEKSEGKKEEGKEEKKKIVPLESETHYIPKEYLKKALNYQQLEEKKEKVVEKRAPDFETVMSLWGT